MIIGRKKVGRPNGKTSFFLRKSNISTDDDFLKTYVIHVRVTPDEKKYLKILASLNQGDNVSGFVRKLIFEVYAYELQNKNDIFAKKLLSIRAYPFSGERTESIHIRLTSMEKKKIKAFARYYHRDVSEFIRWVSLQIYVDDFAIIA